MVWRELSWAGGRQGGEAEEAVLGWSRTRRGAGWLAADATELATVREQGYAVSHGEDVTYSNGASAAVLVHGRPVAAIDLWGPDRRVPGSRLAQLGAAAADAATRVAQLLQPS